MSNKNIALTVQAIFFIIMFTGGLLLSPLGINIYLILLADIVFPIIWIFFFKKVYSNQSKVFNSSIGIFIFGSWLHSIANLLNDHGHFTGIIADTTYFVDEILSHWIMFVAYASILAIAILKDKTKHSLKFYSISFSVIQGLFSSLAILEGNLTIITIGLIGLLVYAKNKYSRSIIAKYFIISLVVTILAIIGWGIYWSEFPEPLDVI